MKINSGVFRLMMVLLTGMMCSAVSARTISGTVKDETGETIISASVMVKGTTIGTVTDFDGNYTLDVPDDAKVLVFSYIGLQTKEVNITGNVIDVVLSENSEVLEEVVVTGYGTTKKRDLVTSVASVGAEQLKDIPVTSAAEALQGKLSGVSVTTTEGSPDAEVKIRVRGGTSLTQSSDPLYIVDGMPVSSISDIAPGDIESMDVLKDAAATAIYGAQGANGVIIITTKEVKADGDKMQIHVDYTGYMGWRTVAKKYDMMNNEDYLRMQYEYAYMANRGSADKMLSEFYKYYDPTYAAADKTHSMNLPQIIGYWNEQGQDDWQDVTFGGNHLNSNHNISVSGGIKAATFNLSYNRIDDESVMYGSNYSRNNLSLKAKFQPVKGLTISTTVRYSNTNVLGAGTNPADDSSSKGESRLRNATSFVPLHGVEDRLADLEDDTDMGNLYNPIVAIDDNWKQKTDNKLSLGGYVEYKFLKHFKVRAELGYESRDVLQDRYYGVTTSFARTGDGNAYAGPGFGHVLSTDTRTSRLKETNTFEYAQKFLDNAHDFSLLIGEEQTINKGFLRTTYGYGFEPSLSGPDAVNMMGLAKTSSINNYVNPTDNMLSFFARANYNYMGRYYITGTFRADASTKFARGNQWGYFPSVAVAWRMIDESWMENAQDVMSNFKFRLSYGTVGNNNVDLGYLYFDYRASNNAYMNGMSNILMDGGSDKIAANSNLKWETTVTRDFGIDYGFFNERLSGSLDLYWNTTRDLILRYSLASGGYDYQFRNIGSTDNKGVEFSIRGVILDHRAKDLSYGLTVDANISYNHNTVVDLGGMDTYPVSGQCFSSYYAQAYEYNLTPGSMIGDVWGYKTDGWYTASDFASFNSSNRTGYGWYNADGEKISTPLGEAYPGMVKIVDTNGDGTIDAKDMVKIGNTMPVVNGGFNVGFHIGGEKWGKLDLAANFTYSIGNDVVNMTALDYTMVCSSTDHRNLLATNGYGLRYSMFDENGAFIPMDGYKYTKNVISGDEYRAMASRLDGENVNAVVANPTVTNTVLTDKFVEDASYLRLSSLTFGYSLAQKWIKKAHISQCRIFFSASNLFCVTNYSGADPEVDTRSKINPLATGMDFAAFPKSRTFNFGINLSFE